MTQTQHYFGFLLTNILLVLLGDRLDTESTLDYIWVFIFFIAVFGLMLFHVWGMLFGREE